ncbi:MAG: hypothetical protein HFE83_05705 [Lachnospiraceae bacterium]|jgi:ESS family glutamate:Na+ symporter|nr:hypothetical protein [Lachnospiraceae bacterium]
MTMATLFNDLMLFGLLLMAGFVVREICPPLQKLFLPASIIGGVVGLILGQQVLGVAEMPESFSAFSSQAMKIIMTCVPLGVTVSAKRLAEHYDFAFGNMMMYGMQLIFGTILGAVLMGIWPGLPEGWGLLGVFAYFGSHGNVATAAGLLEEHGSVGAMDIGMVLATMGVLFSMIIGMIIVNIGVRKGWSTFVKEPGKQPKEFYCGPLPTEKREAIGFTTTSTIAVSPIVFHLGIIAVCFKFGETLFKIGILFVPVLGKVSAMLYGLIGALILWPIMKKLKFDRYVDKKVLTQISNMCVDMMILGAIATLQLSLIGRFFAPIMLHVLLCCTLTGILMFVWFRFNNNPEWFEKFLMVFGMCTGSNAQGYALVRAIDPENKSCIYEALGVYNACFFWQYLLMPITTAAVFVSMGPIVGIGLALMVIPFIISMGFRKKARQTQ